MSQHIVMIGGGIGGLFTGALLTKEGFTVTVLEKNAIIGGGLQCFKRHGETFETGMHILGGFMPGQSVHKILNYLGVLDKLNFKHTDENAIDSITYGVDGKTYELPRGRKAFCAYLSQQFPAEAENMQRYMDKVYQLADEVDLFNLRHGVNNIFTHSEEFLMPADDFIASFIKDPQLRDILAYMSPMYGGKAGHTPAFIHAIINVLYIEGSSQFVDGSQQLATALSDIIIKGGGEIFAGDPVVDIVVEERVIQRVVTQKGKEYTGDWYISDIHPSMLFKLTGPTAFPKFYRERVSSIANSYSAFSVYIKFKPETQHYVNHPRYFQKEYGMIWQLDAIDDENFPKAFMYITPPTGNQGEWASRMLVNCVMSFEEVRKWEDTTVGHRGEEYEAWKEKHMQAIIDQLEQLHPGFRDTIDFCFASSPLTIRDYYNVKEGALYGHMCDCKNLLGSQVTIGTKVKNLLLTGQNVNLHGICGVPLTAVETTEALVGFGSVIDKINEAYSLYKQEHNIV